MYEEKIIESFDGTKLFMRKDYVDSPKAVVVLVHGLSESSDRYRHIAKFLNDNNYDVISYDSRGNGRSGFETGNCNSFKDFIEDLHGMVQIAKEEHKGLKCFILGHSLGGWTVNAYGVTYHDIDGIVSSGAVCGFMDAVKPVKLLPWKLIKNVDIKNELSDVLSHDPEVSVKYMADPFVNKKNKLNLLGEVFIKGVKYVRKNIKELTTPIFYMHGGDDRIVDHKFSEWAYENISSTDKEIKIYDGMYHEIFNEVEKEMTLNDAKEWLAKHE